ncbi:Alcohol dehydrogenase superfamily zinc-containing [Macrophomina phaseolina MS6]|uniref:Alcohol dehydrogenase superfamily zinc-containing n=1 Tax=Macrophomina phaseolina (strain MS6) TaxID=1126212 RepID=K2R0T0_MACPH|nr:Alcohol dehydrogenase superfamily zinc-containing [Macrophomina phaseolina MS6]
MRALRSYGEKDIRVVDVDEPTPSGDKVIINVEWCGICGSDLHLFHMGPEAMLRLPKSTTDATPLIMGHEIAGRIAHSPDPASLPVGAPVVVDPCLFCGNCAPCAARQTQLCAAGISFRGFSTQAGGGFAEKIAVEPSAVYVLPEEAGARLAHAALVEPLAVAWHAVKRAGIATPAWVAVPFVPLMYKEIAVTASCAYNATDLQEVVKAFAAGRFTGVDSMVTARLSLEDVVEKGFDALTNPENTHVKILISPKEL